MREPNLSIPSYRLHKPSGRAVVTLSSKDHYLGPWNDESKAECKRLVAVSLPTGTVVMVICAEAAPASNASATAANWPYILSEDRILNSFGID